MTDPIASGGDGAPATTHTMLLLDDERLRDLRGRLTGDLAPQWRRLAEQCDLYRRMSPPAAHPMASITYLGPAAANLALAYCLTGQPHYLEEAWRWIEPAIGFEHWGRAHMPDHDLDAGWLLHGLSLAFSWLGNDLSAGRREALRGKLSLQGRRMYEFALESTGSWWSSSFWQNHHWICHTGLAAAGYVLGERAWTDLAKDSFDVVVDVLPEDGSDMEGVVYWRYGVPWIAIYLDLLQHSEGIDWWQRCRFLANTFWYRLHQAAPGYEEIIDHGDCHDRRSGHSVALYRILASRYRIGEAQWLADRVADRFFWREAYESGVRPGVLPEAWAELLWHDASVPPVDPATTTPRQAAFGDLGLLVHRTSWDADATAYSFKSAPGGGHKAWTVSRSLDARHGWHTLNAGHHHPDAGSFVLVSRGAWLLVEDGYARHKLAGNHNLVLVDGKGFAGEGDFNAYGDAPADRVADMTDVLAEQGFLHGTARVGAMYPPELRVASLERTLVVMPSGRAVIVDRGLSDAPHAWTLLFHSDHPAERVDDGTGMGVVRRMLRNGRAGAWLTVHSAGAVASQGVTDVVANPTSSTPDLVLARRLHTLRVTPVVAPQLLAVTVIEPFDAFAPTAPQAQLQPCGGSTTVDLGCGERVLLAGADGIIEADDLVTDARAVLVASSEAGGRVAVVGARHLEMGGRGLVDSAIPFTGVLEVGR
ncbi:hypothetical protein GCM10009785_11650 [Brooklawnia cerclae]|uniref:Heparinase II/III-like C-terminal domain-containing protein n=1 Tax=Brooklawnia cerclae TaxID=349934 RepID=A0ABX0SJK4_9ACTN|nr:heparinase II/III family protein [Brooklawnia cerclae]NIH58607.1 hypothetical protein [Brooklawnia cerclae]